MSNLVKSLLLLVALFIGTSLSSLYAQNEPTKGLLYEVSGNGLSKPSYLFGTFHLLKSDFLKEMPKVEESFKKTKGVVVEVDMTTVDKTAMLGKIMMDKQKISDLITEDEFKKLDAKMKEVNGFGMALFNTMKPAGVVTTLSVHMPDEAKKRIEKYNGDLMDMYFMNKAKEKKKKLSALETADQQVDILFGAPINEQVDMLKKYIAKMDQADTVTNRMLDLYFGQDLAGLYQLSMANQEYAGDMKKLLVDRNNNWMKQLPELMKKQPQFVAVGALHLAGPDGLVNQLRNAGYTVKAIE